MTLDTSGRTSPTPFAYYDPASSSWRTSQGTLLSDSTSSRPIWPRSGMTRGGFAYERRTSVRRTAANASSSLLPTPEASDGTGGRVSAEMGGTRPSGAKRAVTLATAVHHKLLPTPAAWDSDRGPDYARTGRDGSGGDDLVTQVAKLTRPLLPTPCAHDSHRKSVEAVRQRQADGRQMGLPDMIALLLPTPVSTDAKGGTTSLTHKGGNPTLLGAVTSLPSDGGNTSSADQHPTLWTTEDD